MISLTQRSVSRPRSPTPVALPVTPSAGAAALFAVSASFCLFTGLLAAARLMHGRLLSNVLRMPMAFFDTTPLGRAMNRFGEDVGTLDNVLPMVISDCVVCFSTVLGTMFAICYATPVFLAVLPPVLVVYNVVRVSRRTDNGQSRAGNPTLCSFVNCGLSLCW